MCEHPEHDQFFCSTDRTVTYTRVRSGSADLRLFIQAHYDSNSSKVSHIEHNKTIELIGIITFNL